ncbi:spore germination protein [Thermoflavimicrobium dichotomicum]|uniref:Spore germination protein KA n=1 Tax=Thermoflavimicrobium dichotomicum TaxID=46223 RepID=A0A1I3KK11_9BACL|nr:spore germination protein [Thermoflavimicrobium dichotomicum]SFI72658.1 spore germination protein KA [Thermoflavimicrobium dichotomicum]
MSFFRKLFQNNQQKTGQGNEIEVFPSLQKNIAYIQQWLFYTDDLKWRNIRFNGRDGVILYLESVADTKEIQAGVIKPIEQAKEGNITEIITAVDVKYERKLNAISQSLLQGSAVLLFDGIGEACLVQVVASYHRDVKEPDNEGVVRGAHGGFIENLSVNLFLVRNRLESQNLVVRYYQLGDATKTKVAVLYMQDLANPDLVKEVDHRLRSISIDTIISPGYIAELTENNPYSPFPQILFTERPDRTVAHLMEGRVAILAEGDPTALIVPVTLFAFYQTPDDFHSRWIVGSFIRVIRLASFLIAFQLPAFYIAVVSFHAEVLPANLIDTVKSSVERVPFPPILEALVMELTLELIREAGIRLPSRVGQTIGIVGGLVIGDAVVRTGLVSYPMVIVVSLTAISSFVVPSYEMSSAVRFLRFPLMAMAALFGFVGIVFGLLFIMIHLSKLESFGTAYLAPFIPLRIKDLKDTFVRLPIWFLNQRPHDPHPKRLNQERYSRGWEHDDQGEE